VISDEKRAELDAIATLRSGQMRAEPEKIQIIRPQMERHFEHEILRRLDKIYALLTRITGFTAKLESNMPFAAGATAVIDFTPQPAGAVLAPGDVPTFTSSDPVNAPVTADSTGLVATVNFAAKAPTGSYTITCSYTNPDGTVATPGTYTGTIAQDITGFTSTLVS
jgi:hypothetical protein